LTSISDKRCQTTILECARPVHLAHRATAGADRQTFQEDQPMPSIAEPPVESGQSYTVTEVDGHEPESLDQFTGDVHLTLARNDLLLHIKGSGTTAAAETVRFYQKDVTLHDRDIRVWTIVRSDDARFLAAPLAAF
jgi:hypothetical protein